MELRTLLAPLALLTDGELGASAKIVSLVHRLDKKTLPPRPLAPTRLTERTGLARKTVAAALAELARSRWSPVRDMSEALDRGRKRSGETLMVKMPAALLTDRAIGAQARVLYGVLQGIPGFDYPSGECTYADLAAFAQLDARTVRRGMRQLVESGWAEITQANRRALVHYTLRDPIASGSEREVAEIRRRVEKARFLGETLMRAYLSLIVDSDRFEDDAAPGFLVNPLTKERLQLDRFYPHSVAFEFNGPQHYAATERFSPAEVAEQRARDLMKIGICVTSGVTLVIVHPEDLTLPAMQLKVGALLPQRNLDGHWPAVNYLESVSRMYRRTARRLAKRGGSARAGSP